MALSSAAKRKEVKKSSYYVWFLGAKESRGLRGEEYIRPVVNYLTEREAEVEPLKVTLQVSGKGLKIIQNGKPCGKGRPEVTKHFIPDHAITCVVQDAAPNDDVVAAILLIYNPVSKCPVHVHAYRCDSVETAAMLRQHLRALVERPDNQRKFGELERRLVAKGLLPGPQRQSGSEGRSVRTESDSSGGGSGSERDAYALDERTSSLYDSLAAELREKLNNKRNHGPMLLPPRDYDTVANKPAPKTTNKGGDSSGKSSGIGSDEAPSSPTHERGVAAPPPKPLHDECSSDEEWERHRDPQAKTERDMILVQSPPGPRRRHVRRSPSPPSSMHPPSPKLPPYRERFYEADERRRFPAKVEDERRRLPVTRRSATLEDERQRSQVLRRSATMDDGEHHRFQAVAAAQPPQRQASTRRDDSRLERQLRRSKSRDEKDYEAPPPLAHSRSFDRLEERKRAPRDKSPPPPLVSVPYREGYVAPLPRVRRLDSGQSSMPSSGHHSAGGPSRYQEIPDEKRYPGLDRETARVQHHYAPKGRDYNGRDSYARDPQWEPREREERRPVFPYAKTSPERPMGEKGHQKRPPVEVAKEDSRFYRYSGADSDYRPNGYRVSAAAGYHY